MVFICSLIFHLEVRSSVISLLTPTIPDMSVAVAKRYFARQMPSFFTRAFVHCNFLFVQERSSRLNDLRFIARVFFRQFGRMEVEHCLADHILLTRHAQRTQVGLIVEDVSSFGILKVNEVWQVVDQRPKKVALALNSFFCPLPLGDVDILCNGSNLSLSR